MLRGLLTMKGGGANCAGCAPTCSLLADVGQVVVAGHVVPLAVLMGDGHHAVLPACKEVVWLAVPPVLVHLRGAGQEHPSVL